MNSGDKKIIKKNIYNSFSEKEITNQNVIIIPKKIYKRNSKNVQDTDFLLEKNKKIDLLKFKLDELVKKINFVVNKDEDSVQNIINNLETSVDMLNKIIITKATMVSRKKI